MGKENGAVGLDEILQHLGPFGRYNIINYILLLIPIMLAGMYGSVFVFEAPDIDYRCNITECEGIKNTSVWLEHAIPSHDGVLSKCKRFPIRDNVTLQEGVCAPEYFDASTTEKCEQIVYFEDSAVRDFDLGCQNWKRTLIGTIRNTGLFVSLPLTGIISDKYGRKLALSLACLMFGVFGLLRSFSPNYVTMLVLEFMESSLGAGAYSTAFVMAMELVGPGGRVFGNTLINIVYVFGLMMLSGLSWWLQNWRLMLRVIYTPCLFLCSYFWILNESVRWLLSKGRHEEAVDILKKAAKINKVDLSEKLLSPLCEAEKVVDSNEDILENKKPSTFKQVLKSSIIRNRILVCSFMWITCTFVYYGLSINSVSLAGNKYVNFMLVAFVEIPANIVCLFVLDRFGRKKILMITYLMSAFLCISLSFLPKDMKWLSLVIYLSGKFSITVSYSSVYIYVSEVFPTSVRQSLLSICSSFGRVGSSLAPLTPLLALYYESLPAIFFGGLALIASVLVIVLPETNNMPLPDTVEEAEMLSNSRRRPAVNA